MDMFNSKNSTGRTTQSYKNGNQLLFRINLSKILCMANDQVDTKLITERPLNTKDCYLPPFPAPHVWPAQKSKSIIAHLPPCTHTRAPFCTESLQKCLLLPKLLWLWAQTANLAHRHSTLAQKCLFQPALPAKPNLKEHKLCFLHNTKQEAS